MANDINEELTPYGMMVLLTKGGLPSLNTEKARELVRQSQAAPKAEPEATPEAEDASQ